MSIKVADLQAVVLKTPDLGKSTLFYRQVWGLDPAGDVEGHRAYLGTGSRNWMLGLEQGKRAELARLRLTLNSRPDVDSAFGVLQQHRVPIVCPPEIQAGPDRKYGLIFRDPDGRAVELTEATPDSLPKRPGRDLPQRLSHVVVNSPQVARIRDFYTQLLGFSVSDWYERDQLIFLRCNENHHCIGVGQGSTASINHVAYLVDDVDAVMQATSRVTRNGCEPIWGPGKHGPGGNVFCYFADPTGVVIEFASDLIQIRNEAEWTPREWLRTPENANVWGTGGPSPQAIKLMSGG